MESDHTPTISLPASIIDNLFDAIILITWQDEIDYMNAAAISLFDLPGNRPPRQRLDMMLQGDDLQTLKTLVEAVRQTNTIQRHEYVRSSGDGRQVSIDLSAFSVRSHAGIVTEIAVIGKDITCLKTLQQDLAGWNTHFRTIIDAVPQLIWENDRNGVAIYFNKRWFEYSGLSKEQSTGPGWQVLIHPSDVHAVEQWQDSFLSGEAFAGEGRLRRHDGVYEWHLLRNIPLRDGDGNILGWFGTATNIQHRKSTELELKATSERLHATLEAAVDFAIVTLDREGYIVDWNSGAEKIFGYQRNEVLGKFVDIFFTPEDRYGGIPMEEIRRAETAGHSLDERWHLRKDGSRFFMSGVMAPIAAPSILGFVKIARDITDRKLAEEALFLSEQRQSIAIQSTKMGEWDWNIPADIMQRNQDACQLMGLEPDAHREGYSSFFSGIHPEDLYMVRQQVETAIGGTNILQSEFRVIRADSGQTVWVSIYGRIITHIEGISIRMIGVIYDITARKKLEKQKDDFISIASHELKTPVSSIKGYSQLVLHALNEKGDTENVQLLKKMNGQVDRLTKLLFALLDSNSVLEGKLRLNPEPFDLNMLIEQEVMEQQLVFAGRRLVQKLQPLPIIHADRSRIRQVLTNLISNAAKYSPEGSDIIISTNDAQDGAMVKVTDFGIGISTDEQQRIFERYYRVSGEGWNRQSFGLGLYISLEIIKQHQGSMGVESIRGKGSTFYFKLPYS